MASNAQIVAQPARGELLYRVVRAERPRVDDVRSHRERPHKRPVPEDTPWPLVVGVSMFDTREGALQIARRRPAWVAELRLAAHRGIHVAATGAYGHRTVWGDPQVLAACVERCHVAP